MTRNLVLASTSSYRKNLMDQLGVPYVAVRPPYEEEHDLELATEELVVHLASKKAESVALDFPHSLIIGSDQVAEIDGERLFKPETVERAVAQLSRLAGRTHRLVTGTVVLEPSTGRLEYDVDTHLLTLRALSASQLRAYVERDRPLDCAGSYKIEGAGVALFESMRGDDYTGIIGLPLTKLVGLLGRFGFEVF